LAISHLAFLGALLVLYQLTVDVFGDRALARRTGWIVACGPWAFVFSLTYTEALFLLLSATALWAAWHAAYAGGDRRSVWAWRGLALLCVAAAALTRPPGALVAIGVGWLFLCRAALPSVRQRLALFAAPLLIAGLAFGSCVLYLG